MTERNRNRKKSHKDELTRKIDRLLDENKPQLGIFWINPRTRKLFAPYATPLERGIDPIGDDEIVDCPITHPELWKVAKELVPELSNLRWDQVPRGRVYFNKDENKFFIYGPASYLSDTNIQDQILNAFNLPQNNSIFEPNQDYEI